ncbi:Fur-regulated basic protein FbpA [Caenibacillus caldisaponilyticus]|uniref:Fur-regulated basic protein FbpA n=1 Tax=Caenibacillus caldisaponilyticus TaxID=1674942 RepID=UPI0011786DC7|nr:Fur-regulated basic protein FbpA [Caenibacillus caldisaponilyticus]
MAILYQSVAIRRQQLIDRLLAAGVTESRDGRSLYELSLTELEREIERMRSKND